MYKLKYFFIIATTISIIASCSKQLNVYPTTSEVDGQIITDSTSARVVLNGVYYRFANAGTDNFPGNPSTKWADIWEYIPSELVGTVYSSYLLDEIYLFKFDYTSSYISKIWNYGYNLVNASNGFLKNLNSSNNISPSSKAKLTAEAKFLRSFGNETLLLYFGQYMDTTSEYGIILRNEFVSDKTITLPRNSVKECYDSIISDIDYAIENLPDLNNSNIYASKTAAKLLKARILINRHVGSDIKKVIELTNDIIQNSTAYALEDSLKNIFLNKGLSSKEVILGIQPFEIQKFKFDYYQYQEKYSATDNLINRLKNDSRSNWIYRYDSRYKVYQYTKYYSGAVIDPAKTSNSEYCYAMRLSEAYLLNAEAYCDLGEVAMAKKELIEVQKRSGITDFTELNTITNPSRLKLKVIEEEIINFVSENGSDWFALRRLPLAQINTINPKITNLNQLIFPIPYDEITKNSKIIQTPKH